MKIAVLGATGGVGTHFVEYALAAGHEVTVLARTPSKVSRAVDVAVVQGDAMDVDAVRDAVAGADVVVSALGSTRGPGRETSLRRMGSTLAVALEGGSAPRVIWCASEGIDGEIPGLTGAMIMKLLAKPLADHRAALDALTTAGVPLTVARPRALNDKPAETNLTEVVGPELHRFSVSLGR
jgi:D-arabinose 1-dehydrogenase-like Zn-dependent alcohol dehydrogenase